MMLFKVKATGAKSNRLEMVIEKIQSTKEQPENVDSTKSGQGSSPLSSSDQASPASSCQSSFSDAADAEEGSTLGATPTTPYECEVCKRAFARSSLLSKHIQTHTEQLQFSCPYCRRLFKHKRSRDRHTKLHTGDKKYKCLHCESAFARSDHLKIHMKTHDNKKPHQCELCNRGYNTAAALASHQQHHSKQEQRRSESSNSRSSASASSPSPGGFRCVQCPETFDRPELLQNHLLLCHKSSESPTTLPTQPSNAHDVPKIACMYCGKDFLTMNHMYQHIHSEHRAIYNSMSNMNSTPVALPSIGIPSPSVEDLSPKARNTSPTYACDRCTMRFDSSLLLQEHVENVHWPSHPRYKYDYGEFGILEQKPTDLSRKRRHEDVQDIPSDCNKPEKRSSLEPSLKQAATSPYESNDKPCICSYCYAQMPNFKMFLLHMESHVAMNAVTIPQKILASCPLCGETAKNALDLGRHIFGHAIANVSAFCCHSCKKPFEKVEHLKKHLLEVHSQTTYKCTICSEVFDTDAGLQIHFSSKHTPECKHFRCNLCSEQVFHDRLTAELHVNMKHSIQTPHGGNPQPYLRFPELETPIQRVLIDRAELPFYQCPFCQKIFKDEYLQYVHMLKEHNQMRLAASSPMDKQKPMDTIKTFKCEVCNRCNITSEAELAAHKKLHHAKTKLAAVSLQCAYCNEHCKSRADLEHHMKSHQVSCGKGKHKCNICDEIFGTSTTLAEHKLSHCKIVAGNSCTQCKALLADEQSFYNHQLQHSTSSSNNTAKNMLSLPANCIVCCQTLQTDVEIKLHAKFHLRHLVQLQKEFLCAVCNKRCDSSSVSHSLQMAIYVCKDCAGTTNGTHSHSHNTQSPSSKSESPIRDCKEKHIFACLKCPRTFTTEEETQTHAAGHMMNEEPSLECHLCRNVLPSPTKLQVHLIEHNFMGIGQYRCYVCSSVFTTAVGLRNHIVGHGLDHRPYECTECKKKFYFETELENHKYAHLQQIKTYDKYIECKKCAHSIPEVAYYSEHVHTCNNQQESDANNAQRMGSDTIKIQGRGNDSSNILQLGGGGTDAGSNSHIVNIKVESDKSDFEYYDHKIKTESSE